MDDSTQDQQSTYQRRIVTARGGVLTPFMRGQPNPGHGNKGAKWSPRARIKRLLKSTIPEHYVARLKEKGWNLNDPDVAAALALMLIDKAMTEGDVYSAKTVLEYAEPPPKDTQPTNVNLNQNNNIAVMTTEEIEAHVAALEKLCAIQASIIIDDAVPALPATTDES